MVDDDPIQRIIDALAQASDREMRNIAAAAIYDVARDAGQTALAILGVVARVEQQSK